MILSYVWIREYKCIHNQGFNFGGKKHFWMETSPEEEKVVLRWAENENYIPDFFQIPDSGAQALGNVTAIVGENGSGKSILIEFLRGMLNNALWPYQNTQFLAVFETQMGYEIYANLGYELNDQKIKNDLGASIHAYRAVFDQQWDIPNEPITKAVKKEEAREYICTIYYSPILDLSHYPQESSGSTGVDVSTDYLVTADSEVHRNARVTESFNPIEFHKFQNVFRQINFLQTITGRSEIETKINAPSAVSVRLIQLNIPNNKTNFPGNFQTFFDDTIKSLNGGMRSLHKPSVQRTIEDIRQRLFLRFLREVSYCIFHNIDRTGQHLDLERARNYNVSMGQDEFLACDPDQKLQTLLRSQNLLNEERVSQIIEWIERVRSTINSLAEHQINDMGSVISFEIGLADAKQHLLDYLGFLKAIDPLLAGAPAVGFIDFDWRNMSSGEKAYLDLFSRLHFGRQLIDAWLAKDPQNYDYPHTLYILIDEGELGFHIRWQQEYVKTLIEWLPIIFGFGEGSQPQIQLIFTTHSPISLSDIPNNHVIYLQQDTSSRNTQVLSKKQMPDRSFAANIHHIMTQSFFMDKGFVGEFAKAKIDDLIQWLNSEEDREAWEDYEQMIDKVIDEPLLKKKLQIMLAAKNNQINSDD